MRKLRVIIPLTIAMVAGSIISFSVALAQMNEDGTSNASKLAIRVAEILGIDSEDVNTAINQARKELRDEAAQKKLSTLVEKDKLTQEQADKYLNWSQSRPEGIPEFGKKAIGRKGKYKGRKDHARFHGKMSIEDVDRKLRAAIESGDMTEEQAKEKLEGLRRFHEYKSHPLMGKGDVDLEGIRKRLAAAIESGAITEEQARERATAFRERLAKENVSR